MLMIYGHWLWIEKLNCWAWLWTRVLVICNIDQACPYNVSSDQQSCKKRICVKRFSICFNIFSYVDILPFSVLNRKLMSKDFQYVLLCGHSPFQCLLKFNLNRKFMSKDFQYFLLCGHSSSQSISLCGIYWKLKRRPLKRKANHERKNNSMILMSSDKGNT